MISMSGGAVLGVVLKGEKVKLVEVDSPAEDQFRIIKITESKLDFPFSNKTIMNGKYISEFAGELRNVINKFGFDDRQAAFSLANDLVIVKKYPLDDDFKDEEIVEQIDWEVQQFSYSTDDEYIIDFQKIESTPRQMVIVAVREAVVNYIKQLFNESQISLKIVDTDVFAAIRAIIKNYECHEGEISALICIEDKGINFTIIRGIDYFFSSHVTLDLKSDTSDIAVSEGIIKVISKELKQIILENKLGEKIEDINRIFLYGDMVQDEVLESLQNTYNIRIDRANPFRRLRFAQNVSVDEYIWSRPETFTVCVGSALR